MLRPRSCSSNWNPPKLPMPLIAGGSNATTIAPGMPKSFGATRATMSLAACPLPLRSAMGFSGANTSP